jgi:predicted metal-dependent HD superfamily phosphohydrolase
MVTTTQIVDDAASFIARLYENGRSDSHLYHTLQHTVTTVETARRFGELSGLDEDALEIVTLGAWLHDAGHVELFEGHEQRSAEIARTFLAERGYPADRIDRVVACILATRYPQQPMTLEEAVVCDADMAHLGRREYREQCDLLRAELASRLGRTFSDAQWLQTNIDFVSSHHYHTDAARLELDKRRLKNIARLQKQLRDLLAAPPVVPSAPVVAVGSPLPEVVGGAPLAPGATAPSAKKKRDKAKTAVVVDVDPIDALPPTLAEKVKKAKTERGIETMFRTTSRNHLDLSAMADNKANIILGITTLIISIVVTLLVRKLDEAPYLFIPTVILLVVTMTSMVLATISTRPKVSSGVFTADDVREKRVNLLFFGNFHRVPLDEYEWGMREMMNDSDYLYGSMIKDIYFLGTVLARKYYYLRLAYNIFMYGMVVSVLAFIVAFLLAPDTGLSPADLVEPLGACSRGKWLNG